MSVDTDLRYGRRGGNWAPDDYEPVDLVNARHCDECGLPVLVANRRTHYACDPTSLVAMACTCAPGCTRVHVGDQGSCDPACEPCHLMTGRIHAEVPEWRRKAKTGADAESAPSIEGQAELDLLGGAA